MIQDIFPHRFDNQYRSHAVAKEDATVFCIDKGQVLVKTAEGQLIFPKARELTSTKDLCYLFAIDRQEYFLQEQPVSLEGYAYEDVRNIRKMGMQPKHEIFAAMTAKHLADWYADNHFCGHCGAKLYHAFKERAMQCPICGNRVYPRIMPAVIVGVVDGERLLLTRYRTGYAHNALIAGFTEIGETMEQTVAREVMEEVGLRVKNIRYYKSQPWGIANDILMGYYCEVDGDPTIHMDEYELKYAEFVEREKIELQPDDFSLTNEMMWMFKNGMWR